MGIEVEQTKIIRADPEVVWELLAKPGDWSSWWTDCVTASTTDDRTQLRDSSRLEVVLQPQHLKLTLRPVVDLFTEGRILSLTHRSAFIHTTAAWYLQARPDATAVKAELVFNGLFPFFVTILQQSGSVQACMQRNLRGLKRAAEQRV